MTPQEATALQPLLGQYVEIRWAGKKIGAMRYKLHDYSIRNNSITLEPDVPLITDDEAESFYAEWSDVVRIWRSQPSV